VHNFLVDLEASSNAMPLLVFQSLYVKSTKCTTHVIQLERSEVKVIGELKDLLLQVASNPKVHQIIDISVVDTLEAYILLS